MGSSPARKVRKPAPSTGPASPPFQSVAPEFDGVVGVFVGTRVKGRQEHVSLGSVPHIEVGGRPKQVARGVRRAQDQGIDLLQGEPEIGPLRQDFEDGSEQVVGVAQAVERLAVEPAAHGRAGLRGLLQEGLGLGRLALAETIDRRQAQTDVLGRLGQGVRGQTAGEQLPPQLFGVQQLTVSVGRRFQVGVVVTERVDLPPGALQVAGEGQQLKQEQPLALVARAGLDGLQLGLDGGRQLTGPIEFGRVHVGFRSPRTAARCGRLRAGERATLTTWGL